MKKAAANREAWLGARSPGDLQRSVELGLPVVYGEVVRDGGYHYYPTAKQVEDWVREAGLSITERETGDGYDHYIVTAPSLADHERADLLSRGRDCYRQKRDPHAKV